MNYVTVYYPQDRMWTVGYYDPDGQWHAMRDCEDDSEAFRFINYLNGGSGKDFNVETQSVGLIKANDVMLTVGRVVGMLREVQAGSKGSRETLESAIKNLETLATDALMKNVLIV